MNTAGAPPSCNGVIRMQRRGMVTFQLGDESPVTMDAIAVYDEWWEIDRNFRDEQGEVAPHLLKERSHALWKFVKDKFSYDDTKEGAAKLTMTEVLTFMKLLAQEVTRLRGFFDDSTSEEESSLTSSDRTSGT